MPIKDLTQNITSVREGMNQIGIMRKGAPKKENAPGEDLDHFRIVLNPQFAHLQPLIDQWLTQDGQDPERPEFFTGAHVLEDTADKAFSFWLEEWGKGGATLKHRCDGEVQHQHYQANGYSFAKIPCAMANGGCQCQRIGRLALWFEPLVLLTGEFGYFTVYTSSKNDIVEIQKQLQGVEYMAARAGLSLMAVPFIFGRYDKAISTPAFKKQGGEWVMTGNRTMATKSLFGLRTDPRWNKTVLLPAVQEAAMLPPPEGQPKDELKLADGVKARSLLGAGAKRRLEGDNVIELPVDGEADASAESTPDITQFDMTPPPLDGIFNDDDDDVQEAEFAEASTEAEAVPTEYDLEAVKDNVRFLYKSDKHRDNSIAKLVEEGEIKPTYNTLAASTAVLLHRCQKDYDLDIIEVIALLNEQLNVPVKSVGEYLKSHTLEDVWGIVQAAKAEPEGKPA